MGFTVMGRVMLKRSRKGKYSMKQVSLLMAVLIALLAHPVPSIAQDASYARLARAYLSESFVAYVTVRGSKKLPKTIAPALPGRAKFLVEADVIRVLKAPGVVNGRLTYVWEGPLDAKGKPPAFKKQDMLVFLRNLNDPAVPFQLAAPDKQVTWSAEAEGRLRAIAQEAQQASLRTINLTGVQSAFTTEADTPYARLTQFLFASRDGQLIGVTVRVKPDGTGDVISSSEEILGGGMRLQANTLMWYHLACTTPASLPADVLSDQPTDDERDIVVKDYATFRQALGGCN
jgi:hypothetical protein